MKPFNKLRVPVLSRLSGHLGELKNKGKVQLGNPKRGHGRSRELFITKFKSQLIQGFTEMVVTRAGHL